MGNILKLIADDTLSVQTEVKAEEVLKKKIASFRGAILYRIYLHAK